MSAEEYRDNDADYLKWRADHPRGYIINIQPNYNPSDAYFHDRRCHTLQTPIDAGEDLTHYYVKVCAKTLSELEQWATDYVGESIQRCGKCQDIVAQRPMCSTCNMYELSVTGYCPSCDEG